MAKEHNKNKNWLWIGIVVIAVIILAFVFILDSNKSVSNEITCNSPYIKVANSCCLDQNSNNICDNDEQPSQPQTYCGDGSCQSTESCSSCSSDCGRCEYCGNGNCNTATESCSNCQSDCGSCPPCESGRYSYYACIIGGGDLVYNEDMVIFSSELTKTKYGDKCKFFHLASGDQITFRFNVGAKGEIYNDETGEKKKTISNAYNVNANYNCVFDKYCSISCSLYTMPEEN